MRKVYFLFFFLFTFKVNAQFSNKIWCFGDSVGVDFTVPSNPVLFSSVMDCRGSCCSIADSTGLLFYANDCNNYWITNIRGIIKNKLHQTMQNGDSIIADAYYDEMVIVPKPNSPHSFYLFHVDDNNPGLYYSEINMNASGGLGAVILKNVQLQTFIPFPCVAVIKHGNGRDWWILFKQSGIQNPNNSYNEYLITPNGILGPYIYSLGTISTTDLGQFNFNHSGTKLAYTDLRSIIEIYDFDRCTGIISNAINISPQNLNPPALTFSLEFSPNDSVLYVSTTSDTSYIFQYDVTAANIATTKDTVASFITPIYYGGFIKMAPDNKIYWSCAWNNGSFNYPYDSSAFYPENMNLSVINNPNALGAACNFAPLSFYLGGKRTYYGLPNNPDYNMGAWVGSPCDTLSAISQEQGVRSSELKVFYHSGWQKAFVNAMGLKGKTYLLRMYDTLGNELFKETGTLNSEYFTKDLNCAAFSNGMYILSLQTEREKLICKFVKQ
jgi:hypothetical protein